MVVTITLCSGIKPNLSSQRPLSLITGTVVWLQWLILRSGWIFRLRTSGRLIVGRLIVSRLKDRNIYEVCQSQNLFLRYVQKQIGTCQARIEARVCN